MNKNIRPPRQQKMFETDRLVTHDSGPVTCLTFENDEKRREYFLERLREKIRKRRKAPRVFPGEAARAQGPGVPQD
jgi:hypothetical protein